TTGTTSTSSTATTTTPKSSTTTTTQKRSTPTPPFSCRKRLGRPRGLVIDDANSATLYVEDKTKSRIFAFALRPDGGFWEDKALSVPRTGANCTESSQKRKEQQPAQSKTSTVAAYESLLLNGSTLLGIQFQRGRVDAYRINPNPECTGCGLSRRPLMSPE